MKLLKRLPFAIFFIAVGALTPRVVDVAQAVQTEKFDEYKILKTFANVITLVEKNYVEAININQMVEGAIKGMLMTLDPHTSYMNGDTYGSLKEETSGEFGGLGIEINMKEGVLTVISPIEDSPAFRAGVKPGDHIIKIEEEFTKNLTLEEAVKRMKGPKGTSVKISVLRKNTKGLLPISIVRDIIKVKSVRYRSLDAGYGYIKLVQFQEGSSEEFKDALVALGGEDGSKLKGLILDVRNNPGGLLNQAIRIADLFLKEGVVVYTEGRLESQKQKYYAHNDGNEPTYPIVLLVNEGSASASEIIAGALQDHGRALVVGAQTFGKGSVQTVLPMETGDALRLTTALYYTKNGRSIQAEGIKPDIEVEFKLKTKEDINAVLKGERVKEKDLPGAIKNPTNKKEAEKQTKEIKDTTKDAKSEDNNSEDKSTGEKGIEDAGDDAPLTLRAIIDMDLKHLLEIDSQLDEALKLMKTWNRFQVNGEQAPKVIK